MDLPLSAALPGAHVQRAMCKSVHGGPGKYRYLL